jgi:hypothetical protein
MAASEAVWEAGRNNDRTAHRRSQLAAAAGVRLLVRASEAKDFFALGGQRNRLKRLDSEKGIQGNPGLFL